MAENSTSEPCILVVDDNHDCADTLAMALQTLGCAAFVAYGGAEAFEAAERLKPVMVLLDLRMPGLDGFEVCRQLRQFPWAAETVIVAVTASQDKRDEALKVEGFDGVFLKPVAAKDLKDLLDALRNRRRSD